MYVCMYVGPISRFGYPTIVESVPCETAETTGHVAKFLILEIQIPIREIKRTNFGNQKLIWEIKRPNFGNQNVIWES